MKRIVEGMARSLLTSALVAFSFTTSGAQAQDGDAAVSPGQAAGAGQGSPAGAPATGSAQEAPAAKTGADAAPKDGAPADAAAQKTAGSEPKSPEQGESQRSPREKAMSEFVDKDRMDTFIRSLSDTGRQTGKNKKDSLAGLKAVLDVRLPLLDRSCDVVVSHEFLRLGYAIHAGYPGAETHLRDAADAIVRKQTGDLRALSPRCRAELKAFAVAILKVYLGQEWTIDDERRFNESRGGPTGQRVREENLPGVGD